MIRAGTIVTCPKCGKELLTVNHGLKKEEILSTLNMNENFDSIGQPTFYGAAWKSICCSVLFLAGKKIHTKEGWID